MKGDSMENTPIDLNEVAKIIGLKEITIQLLNQRIAELQRELAILKKEKKDESASDDNSTS